LFVLVWVWLKRPQQILRLSFAWIVMILFGSIVVGLALTALQIQGIRSALHHQAWTGASLATGFAPFITAFMMAVFILTSGWIARMLDTLAEKSQVSRRWHYTILLLIWLVEGSYGFHRYQRFVENSARLEALTKGSVSAEVLKQATESLQNHHESEEAVQIAKNPNAPSEFLRLAATQGSGRIVSIAASNPATPPDVLNHLAKSENSAIRELVAFNHSTPPSALDFLASDSDKEVRRTVLRNKNSSLSAQMKLAKDPDESLRQELSALPWARREVLEYLSKHDKSRAIRTRAQLELESARRKGP
jgi:hypothetical protein